ncbi:MAG: peptide ABC transporter substrate-binding protein [Rhodospirillales bacterium]|nr:peptide ABC transporter substrate-binding protein [Rhodospirillales bacterium]
MKLNKSIRTKASVLILFVFCCLFSGMAKANDDNNDNNDNLTIGITQFPSTFHPTINAMMAKTYILAMTRRPVTVYDKDWNLICMLCTKLPTIENGLAVREKTPNGGNGIAVTYTIQPNAIWGDGVPVTSRDIIFSWTVGRHPKSGIGGSEQFQRIYKIDAVDEKTFTLHIDRVTFDYNNIGNFNLLPEHLERIKFKEPEHYRNRTSYDTDTMNEGLYNGPYVIDKIVAGSHVVLVKNPLWWGNPPAFKKITVRVVENTAALEANLISGGIDMIAGEVGLSIDQALAFDKRHKTDFQVLYKSGLIYEHIDLNLDNPILDDVRVRRALVYSIDRSAISKQLFAGRQPVANNSINPLDEMYADNIPVLEYNPKKAAQLLADAGWTTLKQGVRQNTKSDKLILEFMTTAGNRTRELVQQVLQSQWKKQGIEVRIINQPARVFFGETLTERKYTGLGMYAWISSPENVPRTTLHSAEIPSVQNAYSGQNYPGFQNSEMDLLIDTIEIELNKDKRRQLWRRIQEIYIDEVPVIPLFFRANAFILPKWLKGVEPTGHQYPTTLWIENWSH